MNILEIVFIGALVVAFSLFFWIRKKIGYRRDRLSRLHRGNYTLGDVASRWWWEETR